MLGQYRQGCSGARIHHRFAEWTNGFKSVVRTSGTQTSGNATNICLASISVEDRLRKACLASECASDFEDVLRERSSFTVVVLLLITSDTCFSMVLS